MKFSNHSIKQFLDELYDVFESPFGRNVISSVEMFQFIKEKSNNFDFSCFEYLIQDIRNYYVNVEFKYQNPQPKPELEIDPDTGYPSWESEQIVEAYKPYNVWDLSEIYLLLEFDIKLDISEHTTLRERIDQFKKLLPKAILLHDFESLLRFSDIAEKEYISRIKNKSTTKTDITTNIIDINYNSLSPTNFCWLLYPRNSDNPVFVHSQGSFWNKKTEAVTEHVMNIYIKNSTDNFNLESLNLFLADIRNFAYYINFHIPNNIINEDDVFLDDDLEVGFYGNLIFNPEKYFSILKTQPEYSLTNIHEDEGCSTKVRNLRFDHNYSLKQRIDIIKKLIPNAVFRIGLDNLLTFSEMAEEKHTRILKNTINEKELEMLNRQKSSISYNKPLNELSSHEFVNKCYFDYVSILDAYNYIKFKTANFNKPEMELFFKEFLVHITCFYFTIKVDTQIRSFTLTDYFSSDLFENKLSDPEILKKGFAHKHEYKNPETGLFYLIAGINTLNSLVEYISDIEEDLKFEHNIQTLLELENKLVYEYEIRHGSFGNFLKSITDTDNTIVKITDISILDNNPVILNPFLPTIWKTKTDILNAHAKLKNSLIKCDIDTWLYWFGNYPVDNPKKIKWIFKEGNKRALTYFVEKISLSKSIDFAKTRKIFDVQVYNKDKFKFSFGEIDNLLS